MNVACITGRLTRDPEVKQTQSGMAVAKFCVAVQRMKKEDGADFITCTAFGKTAEVIGKHFFKGAKIDLTGHIQTGVYQNKDGQKVHTTDVIVDRMEFGESRKAAAAEGLIESESQPAKKPKHLEEDMTFLQIPDDAEDSLPFE